MMGRGGRPSPSSFPGLTLAEQFDYCVRVFPKTNGGGVVPAARPLSLCTVSWGKAQQFSVVNIAEGGFRMRKYLLVAALLSLLLCGVYSIADDDAPKTEIFAGYSFLHVDTGNTGVPNQVPAGFNVDVTHYFFGPLGGTADFQYHKKDYGDGMPQADCPTICGSASILNFHAGPRFKARVGKVEPFAHALLGFTHGNFTPNGGVIPDPSDNVFSTKIGAGVDLVAARHWAIRLAEANFYYTKFRPAPGVFNLNPGTNHQNNFTLSTGIVYRR
jgi:opacity protein-like surface antigen